MRELVMNYELLIQCVAASIHVKYPLLCTHNTLVKVKVLPELLCVLDVSDRGGHIYINQQDERWR